MGEDAHPQRARNDPDGSCGTSAAARNLAVIADVTSQGEGGEAMRDDLDDRLHDAVALDEIELYAEVLSAVAAADGPLTDGEIDLVLGLVNGPAARLQS
jgi:hypothetical protein